MPDLGNSTLEITGDHPPKEAEPAGGVKQTGNRVILTLSGGGLRATLFELGILNYLALAGELPSIAGVVSVSGGSILAAHFALNWDKARQDANGFEAVATRLVSFARTDTRNSVLRKWLWWRIAPFPLWFLGRKPTHFLERQYERLFGEATFAKLRAPSPTMPLFAFVAADPIRGKRVAFTQSGVLKFRTVDDALDGTILSGGTPIAFAVTLSSCFPGALDALTVDNKALRLGFDEYLDEMQLADGGLTDNSGVMVAELLLKHGFVKATHLFACDAEAGMSRKPTTYFQKLFAALSAPGGVLSEQAKQAVLDRGEQGALIRLTTRLERGGLRLPFDTETKVRGFRTDLDRLTWAECYALMRHGAAVCQHSLGCRLQSRPTEWQVLGSIRRILQGAGAGDTSCRPKGKDIEGCTTPHWKWRLVAYLLLAIVSWLIIWSPVVEVACMKWWPEWRPIKIVSEWVLPTPINSRTIDEVLSLVAKGLHEKSLSATTQPLTNEPLTQMTVRIGKRSSTSMIYFDGVCQPPECPSAIPIKFKFRGQFPEKQVVIGNEVIIVGHITRVSPYEHGLGGYVEVDNCYLKGE